MWELFLICLGVGVGAGLLAGALGLGGGVVIVPALIFLFHGLGFPADLVAKMAVATSLSTIMITSISAVRTHHRAGFVRWPVVLRLGVGIVLGAFAGAFIADAMKGELLTRLFGLFAMVIALQMALTGRKAPDGNLPERVPGAAGLGVDRYRLCHFRYWRRLVDGAVPELVSVENAGSGGHRVRLWSAYRHCRHPGFCGGRLAGNPPP